MSTEKRKYFRAGTIACGLGLAGLLPGVPSARAQQPTHLAAAGSAPGSTPIDKIAPTMQTPPAYDAHAELLKRLYPMALLDPLSDHFDRGPGGFPAALARARAAGIPDGMLAEVESTRATFDINFPALAAALARMQAARATWQETTSIFATRQEFETYLGQVAAAVAHESAEPGSFAQMAMRLRKRDIARAVYHDLRVVDGCADQYAIVHYVRAGDPIPLEGLLAYAPTKTHVWINRGTDVMGHSFGPQRAGDVPAVPPETYRAVADAVPDTFWKPFTIPAAAPAK